MDWDDIGPQAAELMGAIPSWDAIKGAAGGAYDAVSGVAGGAYDAVSGAVTGMGNIDPSWAAEMIGPGGLPGDFLPNNPGFDFDPSWAAELVGPGGLPGDFLPNNPGFELPSMPSIPSLPWGSLAELMAPLPFFGGGGAGGGGSSGGGGASGSY